MGDVLRVLLLEDQPTDAELVLHALRQSGFDPHWKRVDTEIAYLECLSEDLDVILADFSLPQFSAPNALALLQERGFDIPFIIVTGTVSENAVIECMQRGAADYLLKDRLTRLGPAIRKALLARKLREEGRQAEAALRESEARYRQMFEGNRAVKLLIDPTTGTIIDANLAACDFYGYSHDDLMGTNLNTISMLSTDVFRERLNIVRNEKQTHVMSRHQLVSGEVRDVEIDASLIDVEDQQYIFMIIHDITERKLAEEALERERVLLRTIIDNIPDYIFVADTQKHIIASNLAYTQSIAQTITAPGSDSSPSEPQLHANDALVLESGEAVVNAEERVVAADGNEKWYLTTKVPLKDGAEQVVGLVGIGHDITTRKHMETALYTAQVAEHEERIFAEALRDITLIRTTSIDQNVVLQRILDNVGRVVPHDAANIMLIRNNMLHTMWFRSNISMDHAPTVRPIGLNEVPNFHQIVSTGAASLIPDTQTDPDWIDVRHDDLTQSYLGAPIRAHGRIIGILNLESTVPGFFTPVHAERLEAFADEAAIAIENAQLYDQLQRHASALEQRVEERTEQLRAAKDRVESILNNSVDAIVLLGSSGIISQSNPAFTTLFGYTGDDVFRQPLAMLAEPAQADHLQRTLQQVVSELQPVRVELNVHRKDGKVFTADIALSPMQESDTEAPRIICSIRDISERKQLEQELRSALEQEKELGEMKSRFVSMSSHEFRTPLTTIMSSSGLIEVYLGQMYGDDLPPTIAKHLINIDVSVRRMTELLDDVLTIGKADVGLLDYKPEVLDLDELCQEILQEVQPTTTSKHQLAYASVGECTQVVADRALLRHVLVNLLSNALKYSPHGGTVRFDIECNKERMVFRIQDEGIGIPEKDQAHLFESFHRASNVGIISGTGLGLAIAKRSVDAHGGTISVESQLGIGTTFTVSIPYKPQVNEGIN